MGNMIGFQGSVDNIFFRTVPEIYNKSLIYSIADVLLAQNGGFPGQLYLFTEGCGFHSLSNSEVDQHGVDSATPQDSLIAPKICDPNMWRCLKIKIHLKWTMVEQLKDSFYTE